MSLVEGVPVLERDGERERFDRRAGRSVRAGGEVEASLAVATALPRRHRAELSGGTDDDHQRVLGFTAGRQHLLQLAYGGFLQVEVERRAHAHLGTVEQS